MVIKGTGGLGNKKTRGDYPNHYIIENGQNTEKSPVKNYELKLMRKTLEE